MSVVATPIATTNHAYRSWVEVDLEAVRHNATVARQQSGSPIMAIIKANAYGHGSIKIASALADKAAWFGVANLQEALELRASGIQTPLYLLGSCLQEEWPEALRHEFSITISSLAQACELDQLAGKLGVRAHVHAVLETGMGRLGFLEEEWQQPLLHQLLSFPHLVWEGIASHLPVADEDASFTLQQIVHFERLVKIAHASGLHPKWTHLANSAGVLGFPNAASFCNLSRPGLMLYGVSPLPECQSWLQNTLTWKTRITLLRTLPPGQGVSYGRTIRLSRPTRVATLACGYADGYPRQASNQQSEVLLQGHRCPLLGRVTMDQIMVDVTDLPQPAQVGDEVVLLGQQGSNFITPNELACKAGTIAWDIFTGIGRRVVRIYPTSKTGN